MQPTGSITPTPVARVIALVTTLAVLTGHLRTIKVRLAHDQKTHQKADNGYENNCVKHKACVCWQTFCVRDPTPENAANRLIGRWASNRHVGHKWDQVVEAHLIFREKNLLTISTVIKVGWVHLLTLDSTGTVRRVLPLGTQCAVT
jgi:hypothetical protein